MPVRHVKIVDAGGGGDCFFFSLYRAAIERGKLAELMDCFSMGAELDGRRPKADFMEKAREYLARNISHENEQIIQIHTHLSNLLFAENGNKDMRAILENLPDFYESHFSEGPGSIEDFAETIADEIEEPGTWVGQIEVEILKELLDICDIKLKIHNSNVKELNDDGETLHLFNQNNVHFKYVSFSAAAAAAATAKKSSTRKQSKSPMKKTRRNRNV